MDNATLVAPAIESGRQLLEVLDEERFDAKAAFWYYREESEEWRSYIATPQVKRLGPHNTYSKVLNVLRKSTFRPSIWQGYRLLMKLIVW